MTFTWNGDAIFRRARTATLRGLYIGALAVEESAINSIISGSKSGVTYKTEFWTYGSGASRVVIPGRPRPAHTASAPGEAPASDTGRLVNSSEVNVDDVEIMATINFADESAPYLEFGYPGARGTFVQARPFLLPALNKNVDVIRMSIENELKMEFSQ